MSRLLPLGGDTVALGSSRRPTVISTAPWPGGGELARTEEMPAASATVASGATRSDPVGCCGVAIGRAAFSASILLMMSEIGRVERSVVIFPPDSASADNVDCGRKARHA